ncbi:MAG: MMPL family transporter [Chloroflexi bacterium]|nr:MMPL family transporter [Chloroflexota bacterium]
MLYRLGIAMARFRWAVIGVWAALFLLSAFLAPRAPSALISGFGRADTESQRALDLLKDELGEREAVVAVVFSHETLTVKDAAFRAAVEQSLADVAVDPQVEQVVSIYTSGNPNLASRDGRTTYAAVVLKGTVDEAMELYPALRRRIGTPSGFQVWATGAIPIFSDLTQAAEDDLRRAEMIAFPLLLVALLLVFRTVVAAAIPVSVAAIAVNVTLAIVFLLAQVLEMSIFVLNVASFLGIGLAVDYSLLVVSRFREELQHRPRQDAIGVTLATAGRAILFSGFTAALGLSGLLWIQFAFFRSMGIGGVVVILMSMAVALTLVPAVLATLGHRINSLAVLPARPGAESVWRRIAQAVMRHPVLVAVPVAAGLLLLGTPLLRMRVGAPWASVLPPGAESRQGWEVAERELGAGALSPVVVVARAPQGVLQPTSIAALYDFTRGLLDDPRVERVESIVTLDPAITKAQYQQLYASPDRIPVPQVQAALKALATEDTTVVRVYPRAGPVAEEVKALVTELRAQGVGPGFTTLVTGATADLEDSLGVIYGSFPYVILYVIVSIYLVLLVLFRSVVLPLKAVLMDALSLFASYGALVYVFQDGHFQGLLGFTTVGQTETTVPILLFCIVFGLSMDYEVFLLSRVKELYDETGDNTGSVALGLERTGRIITSAALILVLVAGAFATSSIIVVKAFGVGTAVAILVDATLVRALLVPALMRLLGQWNWWAPAFLRRLLPERRVVPEG